MLTDNEESEQIVLAEGKRAQPFSECSRVCFWAIKSAQPRGPQTAFSVGDLGSDCDVIGSSNHRYFKIWRGRRPQHDLDDMYETEKYIKRSLISKCC